LIRSAGGWAAVTALKKEKVHVKSDERVLGDGDFVEKILPRSRERYERQYALKASGIDLDHVAARVRVAGNGHRAGPATGQIPTAGSGAQSAVLLGRAGAGQEHDGHGRAAWHLHAGGKQGGGPGGCHCRAKRI